MGLRNVQLYIHLHSALIFLGVFILFKVICPVGHASATGCRRLSLNSTNVYVYIFEEVFKG